MYHVEYQDAIHPYVWKPGVLLHLFMINTTKVVGLVEYMIRREAMLSNYNINKEWVVPTHSCTYLDGLPMQERNTTHSEMTLLASNNISGKLGTYQYYTILEQISSVLAIFWGKFTSETRGRGFPIPLYLL